MTYVRAGGLIAVLATVLVFALFLADLAASGLAGLVLVALIVVVLVLIARQIIRTPRKLAANRIRRNRMRLYMRLRPGVGLATTFQLWLRWGRFAAARRARFTRPQMTWWQRIRYPAAHSIVLGHAQYRRTLRPSVEEHIIMFAPPRGMKTVALCTYINRYPGPVLSTTTKHDVFELTSGIRQMHGPVEVFNPQRIGKVPSTFTWDPVADCTDPATAIRRADAFMDALNSDGMEDASFWTGKGTDYMRAFFHAAALGGGDFRTITAWIMQRAIIPAQEILLAAGATHWAAVLRELKGENKKTVETIFMTMSRAVQFMTDPALAACVIPAEGCGLDIRRFLQEQGTIYMIAEPVGKDSPMAALFACLTTEIHYTAALTGSQSPSGRLDPPLLMALDEVTQICPVPLPTWLADSGGKGIQIITVVHGQAQLAQRWKDHGKQIIMDTSGVKVWVSGITDLVTLGLGSKLCGTTALAESGGDGQRGRHDILTPEMIRELPAGFALVIRGGLTPVIVKLPNVYKTRQLRTMRRAGIAVASITAAPSLIGAEPPALTVPRQSLAAPPVRLPEPDPAAVSPRDLVPSEDDSAMPWVVSRRGWTEGVTAMTDQPDGLTAALLQLAQQAERLALLDQREGEHFRQMSGTLGDVRTAVTGLQGTIADQGEILASLEGLDAAVAELAGRLGPADEDDGDDRGYRPIPAAQWWELDDGQHAEDREAAVMRLRSWVRRIYVPYYGQLAKLGPCWEQHAFCLVTLDWLSELWSVLYLQPKRGARDLAAQAEFTTRILPAAAEQMRKESTECPHAQKPVNGQPRPAVVNPWGDRR